jgi:HSP20 family protein
MNIVRYRQWPGHRALHQHAFERLAGAGVDGSDSATQWQPLVDIREEADRFVILADLPGVDPQDIEIQMDKGILSIRGERKAGGTVEAGRHARIERRHGRFHRRFALPDSADADGIVASGRDGVLEIAIPKKPETTPRRIQVGRTQADTGTVQ